MMHATYPSRSAIAPTRRAFRSVFAPILVAMALVVTGVLTLSARGQAQDVLTPAQRQAVQAPVNAAIAAVNAQNLNSVMRQAALFESLHAVARILAGQGSSSIAYVATAAIAGGVSPGTAIHAALLGGITNGAPPDSTTAAIIATSLSGGVPVGAIGGGIGLAASAIEKSDPTKAQSVAASVARLGTDAIRRAFAAGINQAGGSKSLASIAGATVTGRAPNVRGER